MREPEERRLVYNPVLDRMVPEGALPEGFMNRFCPAVCQVESARARAHRELVESCVEALEEQLAELDFGVAFSELSGAEKLQVHGQAFSLVSNHPLGDSCPTRVKRRWRTSKASLIVRHRVYYRKNKAEIDERHRLYALEHREATNARSFRWYHRNREKVLVRRRVYDESRRARRLDWKSNHREETRFYNAVYYQSHRDEILLKKRESYRARTVGPLVRGSGSEVKG